MQLYTLTRKFIPNELINQFTSAIWTERYSSAGDMQLVVPATPYNLRLLRQGTFIGLRGTKEIMMLETQSVEKSLLTVTGSSLVKFLGERMAWFRNEDYDAESSPKYVADLVRTTTPAQMISTAVQYMAIDPEPYTSGYALANLDWTRDTIPGLQLGAVSESGTSKQLTFPNGPLYEGIQRIATDEGVGIKLYLESAQYRTGTWVLKFATYLGKDRTSGQETNALVRLTPKLDSLSDVKEIGTLANYKNVIYVNYKNKISTHYIDPSLPIPEGFDRRVLLVEAPDIYLATEARITAYRETVARNEAAKHIYVQTVDGQISPQIGYQFRTDYNLGDIIELEGFTGIISKARITEYIRSQDQFGEREYPTLAVIDPLATGFMPDVEPDSDTEPPGDGDPDTGDEGPGDGDGNGDGGGFGDPDIGPGDGDGDGGPNSEPNPNPPDRPPDPDDDVVLDPHIRFVKGLGSDWFWDPHTLSYIYVPFDPDHPDEWEKPNEDCYPATSLGSYLEIWGHGFGTGGNKFSSGEAQIHVWSPDRTWNYHGALDPFFDGQWQWRGIRLTATFANGPAGFHGMPTVIAELWLTYQKDGEEKESNHVFFSPIILT